MSKKYILVILALVVSAALLGVLLVSILGGGSKADARNAASSDTVQPDTDPLLTDEPYIEIENSLDGEDGAGLDVADTIPSADNRVGTEADASTEAADGNESADPPDTSETAAAATEPVFVEEDDVDDYIDADDLFGG